MHGHLWSGRAFSGGPSFGTGTFFFFFDEKIRGTVLTVLFFVRRREKMYAIGHAGSQHCSTELQGSCVFRLGRKSLPVLGLK